MDTVAPTAPRCFICGYDNPHGLEQHHLVPRRYGGSDQPENLVQLCASCHAAIEKLYDDEFYQRLGVSSHEPEGSPLEMDIDGTAVSPEESFDRELTDSPREDGLKPNSHIRIEGFTITIPLSEFWNSTVEDIVSKRPQYGDYLKERLKELEETIADSFKDGTDGYTVPPESKRETPTISIYPDKFSEPTHRMTRLHCGYCHTVFSEDEHSNLARHLRIIHGVEDPYQMEDRGDGSSILDRR